MHEGRPLVVVVGGSDTGRTPMVAGLLRAALGEDVVVHTGGVLAHTGESAVTEAQMALEQLGVSLREHRAQPLTAEHRRHADLLLAVDRGTALVVHSEFPHDERVVSLAALCDQPDVLDPHRMPLGVWVVTARQLQAQVTQAVPELRQRLHLAATSTASTAPATPTAHPSTTNAPTANDDVERMTRLLLTAETLPMIVDWTRVRQELVQMGRALAAARTASDDLLPGGVLMLEGALTYYATQPSATVLQRMCQAIERFDTPLDSTALADVGQLLLPEA